jgi:hypothetical protein
MSEGAKISPEGKLLLLPECRRGAVIPKRKGSFDRCGGRLKELFEKSSLRNLKNFKLNIILKRNIKS